MPEICVACGADYPASLRKNPPSLVHCSGKTLGEIADKCSATLHIFRDDGSGFWEASGVSKVNIG